MKLLTTQEQALAAMLGGENVCATGKAGTGKSTVVREFVSTCPHPVDVTASTGIAAINVRGRTLHSFCGIGLGPRPGQPVTKFIESLEQHPPFARARERIRRCRTLIVDEVSMLDGRIFDLVDHLFKHVRRSAAPFGGIQLIVVGDFLQLAPVRKGMEPYDWAFDSPGWRDAGFTYVNLERVWRQDEPEFIDCLNDFRQGNLSARSSRLLQGRVIDFPDDSIPRLLTHNVQVDKWNRSMLDRLPGKDTAIPAIMRGPQGQLDFLCRNLTTPEVLVLREGATVMFTANAPASDGRRPAFVNGQTGTVRSIGTGFGLEISVETDGGALIPLERYTWQYDWQDKHSAAFTQFPLRLAYGMTIHKAQGLTMHQAFIDIRAAREPGQAYVALSRVRSLEGVFLKAWFNGFVVSRRALEFYENLS